MSSEDENVACDALTELINAGFHELDRWLSTDQQHFESVLECIIAVRQISRSSLLHFDPARLPAATS